jgi:hypothetical protein
MSNTTQQAPDATRPVNIRPFRARVTVRLQFIDDPTDTLTEVDAPLVFEAAHASMLAAVGSLAHASIDNPKAKAAARRYLEALPDMFDAVAEDPAKWVEWREPRPPHGF